ncbi:MAG: nucleotidyltransferase domain-containing protein [Acidobacteriota bacterium]
MRKLHPPAARPGIVRRLTEELERHPEVVFAYLYGSCAESLPFRDIDLGVFLQSSGKRLKTAHTLSAELSSALALPVDVQLLNRAPTSFLYHVLKGSLLISRDDDLLADLIEETARQYLDLAPLRRQATREAFG